MGEIELRQAARVTVGNTPARNMKAGEKFSTQGQTALIESTGFVSTLIIPMNPRAEAAKVTLKPIDKTIESRAQPVDPRLFNELLIAINEVQARLALNKPKDALSLVESLQAKTPGVTYLDFLKASCYVVAGENSRAKALLEKALKEFPDNKQAQELYERLSKNASLVLPLPESVK